MLDIAQERVERSGWKNVELVQTDIAAYDFPEGINGVLATGIFGYIPEYDCVIKAACQSLVPGCLEYANQYQMYASFGFEKLMILARSQVLKTIISWLIHYIS